MFLINCDFFLNIAIKLTKNTVYLLFTYNIVWINLKKKKTKRLVNLKNQNWCDDVLINAKLKWIKSQIKSDIENKD